MKVVIEKSREDGKYEIGFQRNKYSSPNQLPDMTFSELRQLRDALDEFIKNIITNKKQ